MMLARKKPRGLAPRGFRAYNSRTQKEYAGLRRQPLDRSNAWRATASHSAPLVLMAPGALSFFTDNIMAQCQALRHKVSGQVAKV